MTIKGAIAELQNLLGADDIPLYYKTAIEKVIETIMDELNREPSDDLISRTDAIKEVASYIWHLPNSVYPHFNSYNVIENFVMDALSALPPAEAPRSIDPTIEVDLESGVVPRSACEPRETKTIVYENNERS